MAKSKKGTRRGRQERALKRLEEFIATVPEDCKVRWAHTQNDIYILKKKLGII